MDRVVKRIETDIFPFGNRVDLISVDDGVVRVASRVLCDDLAVRYFSDRSSRSQIRRCRQLDLFIDYIGM